MTVPPDHDLAHRVTLPSWRGMDLRRIEAFIVVATELHFGRAANRLHIAQSALSQQIRKLEGELGVTLMDRTTRRVELTPAGHVFLRHARLAVSNVADAARAAQRCQAGELGHLVVGFAGSTTYELMPKAVKEFRRYHPDVGLTLRGEMVTGDQVDGLLRGDLDVGFLRSPVVAADLEVVELRMDPLIAAVPESHPQAAVDEVDLASLADAPFVTYPGTAGSSTLLAVLTACLGAGFTPNVAQEGRESHTLISLVAAGLGVALVPAPLRHLQMPGVVYRPLRPPVPEIDLSVAWRRSEHSPLVERFVDTVQTMVAVDPS